MRNSTNRTFTAVLVLTADSGAVVARGRRGARRPSDYKYIT